MKSIAALIILTLLATTVCRASYVTDAVAQMPAKNSADESVLAAKLMGAGVPGVKEVCAMLVPPGAEGKGDTAARYAIGAMVRHAGRPGGENDRANLVKGICDVLGGDADAGIKVFLVNRLQEVGHDDAVPSLANLLADEKVSVHASAALERIGSPAAVATLNRALPTAGGATRVALIKSLGTLRATDAAAEIRKSATDDDKTIRMTALWALANLGDAATRDLLGKAEKDGKSAYDKSRINAWAILCIKRLTEAGKKQEAFDYCMSFLGDAAPNATPSNVKCAAARALAEIEGESALGTLFTLAEGGDGALRATALDAAARIQGPNVTDALAARLKSAAQPEVKADLLDALARRRDTGAQPAVLEATNDQDAAVRLAAMKAAVALGGQEAIPALVDRVTADKDPLVAKAAGEMLARMSGDKALAAAADALATAPSKAKAILLDLLTARAAGGQKDAIFKQTSDPDAAVRGAALKAMEKVAGEQDVARLIEFATAAQNEDDASSALKAAAAGASQIADADRRADAFVAALPKAKGPKRAAIERAMAKVGGKAALQAVVADLKSEDKATREGALSALSEWQEAAALAPLLEAAKSGADPAQQVNAVRGAVQVAKASPLTSAERAAVYAQAMGLAKRAEEKRMILGALGFEHGPEAFEVAAAALGMEGFQAEASLATIKTILPQPKGLPGLKGPKVIEALRKAIPACPDGGLKADAQRYLTTLDPQKK